MHVDSTTYLMGVKRIEIEHGPNNSNVVRIKIIGANSDETTMTDSITLSCWGSPHGTKVEVVETEDKVAT